MKLKQNKFGTMLVHTDFDLWGTIYITSAACMSVFAETLGWANMHRRHIVDDPALADNIIVLSCQVTDLAILNDFRLIERLRDEYKGKKYFVGGCLAQRFDIKLPENVFRIDHLKADYQRLWDLSLIHYEKPFWVTDFSEEDSEYSDGHLFRGMYPLRVGVGCHGKCKYCTIKTTRGTAYNLESKKLEDEFVNNDNILITGDSITARQILEFAQLAIIYHKQVSFRNVEPPHVVQAAKILIDLASMGLLKVLHTPVQASRSSTLQVMGRDPKAVLGAIEVVKQLKEFGVFTTTNVIIDYPDCPNDFGDIYEVFDYVSWNPYWGGDWDRAKARERWQSYIEGGVVSD